MQTITISEAQTITIGEALEAGRVTYTSSWLRDAIFYLANTHVLLSVFFAHPAHPYNHCRRFLMLINSLSFGFFITAVLHALVPWGPAQSILAATVGIVAQLIFDAPASILASCCCAGAAAQRCLPAPIVVCFRFISFMLLSLHCCMGVVYALLGALLLTAMPSAEVGTVWASFQETKVAAFVVAVPFGLLSYALLRQCERGTPLPTVVLQNGSELW